MYGLEQREVFRMEVLASEMVGTFLEQIKVLNRITLIRSS